MSSKAASPPQPSTSSSGSVLDQSLLKNAAEQVGESITSFTIKMAAEIGSTVSQKK